MHIVAKEEVYVWVGEALKWIDKQLLQQVHPSRRIVLNRPGGQYEQPNKCRSNVHFAQQSPYTKSYTQSKRWKSRRNYPSVDAKKKRNKADQNTVLTEKVFFQRFFCSSTAGLSRMPCIRTAQAMKSSSKVPGSFLKVFAMDADTHIAIKLSTPHPIAKNTSCESGIGEGECNDRWRWMQCEANKSWAIFQWWSVCLLIKRLFVRSLPV